MNAEIYKKLLLVQANLNAPKNQVNKFGGYNYRSCEDILMAVKPLLLEHGLILNISDDIEVKGDRTYVVANVKVMDGSGAEISSKAYAREPLDKKGADASQITGAASSYARKYALSAMFLLDDQKDADTQDNREKGADNNKTTAVRALTKSVVSLLDENKDRDAYAILSSADPELRTEAWKELKSVDGAQSRLKDASKK